MIIILYKFHEPLEVEGYTRKPYLLGYVENITVNTRTEKHPIVTIASYCDFPPQNGISWKEFDRVEITSDLCNTQRMSVVRYILCSMAVLSREAQK